MRLVADHDRVGARDLAGVAHEPLVRLDGDRAHPLDGVLALQQGPADPLGVAPLAQLAVELVDEVATVGEDQHPPRLGGLDEAEGRDRLARAGRVLEPEALGRIGILGLLAERLLFVALVDPVAGLVLGLDLRLGFVVGLVLVLELLVFLLVVIFVLVRRGSLDRAEVVVLVVVLVLVLLVVLLVLVLGRLRVGVSGRWRREPLPSATSSGPRMSAEASSSGEADASCPLPSGAVRCASASSAVSVPDRASTWWADRTVPSTSRGSSSDSSRSSPSSSENSRRQAVEGCFAFGSASSSASARSRARRRGVPGARATAGSSPSCRKRSRTSFSAREISAEVGMVAAARATEVDSAMQARLRDGAAVERDLDAAR